MKFLAKFLLRVALNGAALWIAKTYIPGFALAGDIQILAIAALVLALLNVFLAPLLRLVTLPLRWLTLGLFNMVIYAFLLWIAAALVPQITISGYTALILTSLVIAFANALL